MSTNSSLPGTVKVNSMTSSRSRSMMITGVNVSVSDCRNALLSWFNVIGNLLECDCWWYELILISCRTPQRSKEAPWCFIKQKQANKESPCLGLLHTLFADAVEMPFVRQLNVYSRSLKCCWVSFVLLVASRAWDRSWSWGVIVYLWVSEDYHFPADTSIYSISLWLLSFSQLIVQRRVLDAAVKPIILFSL